MTKQLLLLITVSALAACQTTPPEQPIETEKYRALGTEPFWSLTIDGGKMTFDRAGEKPVTATNYKATPSFNGWRYVSKAITTDVTFSQCSDGMSDWTYKDTVTVMVGTQEYKGCGGGIIAPESLEETEWRINSINGASISAVREARLDFNDGRMNGTVGCNRLGASYQFLEKKLSVGPVMSTKMACPEPVGAQENALVGLLGGAFNTEFPGDGTMVLTAKNGTKIVLKQSM
jgi:heat shock protein HslJ